MTASTPTVSVVIPAYNADRTIVETVDSALGQVDVEVEVIVVDDGSTDETASVIEAISDPRVRLIRQPNAGVAVARNTGIEHSRGTWVAFLDSDDLWVPHKLRAQLDALAAMPNGFAAQASAYFVNDELEVLSVRRCVQPEDSLLTYLRFQNLPNAASSWIVRREVLDQVGGFDAGLVILEDWDFSVRLARYGEPLNMEEPLSLYRVHPGNRSRNLEIHVTPGFTVLDRLFADPGLPAHIRAHRREIYARFYTMLCGGALRSRNWTACAHWGGRALLTDPRMVAYIAALPLRRVQRRLAAHRPSATAQTRRPSGQPD